MSDKYMSDINFPDENLNRILRASTPEPPKCCHV